MENNLIVLNSKIEIELNKYLVSIKNRSMTGLPLYYLNKLLKEMEIEDHEFYKDIGSVVFSSIIFVFKEEFSFLEEALVSAQGRKQIIMGLIGEKVLLLGEWKKCKGLLVEIAFCDEDIKIINYIEELISPKEKSKGCYIATMAYDNYDHPQVMILREFRDTVLEKSIFGRWFIKTYYHLSPILVQQLKNKKMINIFIRKTLNQFIKLIK